MSDLFTAAAIGAIAVALAAPLVRWAVGNAIRDQRHEVEAQQRAAIERQIDLLQKDHAASERLADKLLDEALEARKALPVWSSGKPPSEDVLSYARLCLKRMELPFMGSWEFIAAYDDMDGWLDHIGSGCFYVEETRQELRIAQARLEAARAYVRLVNAQGGDTRYARREKKAGKKAVAYLRAALADGTWQCDHYVRYVYEMNNLRLVEDLKAKRIFAEERVNRHLGPRPEAPKKPRSYKRPIAWSHLSLTRDWCSP